jgi:hypothetical protein
MALVDGLRENTKLQNIFYDSDHDDVANVDCIFSPGLEREINFILSSIAKVGFCCDCPGVLNLQAVLGLGARPAVSSPRDTSLLYFLQNKPKIVKCKAAATRKTQGKQ